MGTLKMNWNLWGIPSQNKITCKWKRLSRPCDLSIHIPFGKLIYLLPPALLHLEGFFKPVRRTLSFDLVLTRICNSLCTDTSYVYPNRVNKQSGKNDVISFTVSAFSIYRLCVLCRANGFGLLSAWKQTRLHFFQCLQQTVLSHCKTLT